MAEERWVFLVRLEDAPGALTALSSVFSSRGVSIDLLLGNGRGLPAGGSIVLAFRAGRAKMDTLLRVARRLEKVREIRAYPYADPQLRAVALAHLTPADTPLPNLLPVQAEVVANSPEGPTLLLSGSTLAVDQALALLDASGRVRAAMLSVMAV